MTRKTLTKMSAKTQRLCFIVAGLISIAIAVFVISSIFRDNLVFFFSPTELAARHDLKDKVIRIGGLVMDGSVEKLPGGMTHFSVTDLQNDLLVKYQGLLPSLFREGQGVVVQGKLEEGFFAATEVLAKHDENYMPKEVADSLKESGRWQE